MKRLAVVGASTMARVRTEAFLSLGSCRLCGVAARRSERARAFAESFGCPDHTDDYRALADLKPDVVLVAVPHDVQDEVVLWSLEQGFHTLIGGCLARNVETAERIAALARTKGVVVETGYEARYKGVWERTKALLDEGAVGTLVAVRSVALYPATPNSWYYDEEQSGGMVLTHMSYAFINPLRWLLGTPCTVAAFANKKHRTAAGHVKHEMCTANLLFENDVICNLVAGFVKPEQLDAWHLEFIGTSGSLSLRPGDLAPGSLALHRDGQAPVHYSEEDDAFAKQVRAFLEAVDGRGSNLNPADDSIVDVRLADLIVRSIETRSTLNYGVVQRV